MANTSVSIASARAKPNRLGHPETRGSARTTCHIGHLLGFLIVIPFFILTTHIRTGRGY